MSSFFYFIKESFKGFTRKLSTALGSIVTIFLSLLIIGVFLVGGFVIEKLVSSVENEVSITAYVADDASEADIQTVENYIKGLDGVASVSFTTKDQALEKFRETSTSDILDALDEFKTPCRPPSTWSCPTGKLVGGARPSGTTRPTSRSPQTPAKPRWIKSIRDLIAAGAPPG